MAFEDSMIDAGFHDEEEYLEHLMDEAAEEFCSKQKETEDNYYDENVVEETDENEDNYKGDLYPKEREEYKEWIKENPFLKELFIAWLDIYYPSRSGINEIIEAFLEWRRDIKYNTSLVENYYGCNYPRIIEYFKWKVDNTIEEILRFPQIEYVGSIYDPLEELSQEEILLQKVLDFENWLRIKENYKKWVSKATDKEKKQFFEEVKEYYFDKDVSTENIRHYILQQLDDEYPLKILRDIIRDKVLRWFDNDAELACKTIFEIQCIYFKEDI